MSILRRPATYVCVAIIGGSSYFAYNDQFDYRGVGCTPEFRQNWPAANTNFFTVDNISFLTDTATGTFLSGVFLHA